MANYNHTELTCNDVQRFTELMQPNSKWFSELAPQEGINFEDGVAYFNSRNSIPDEKIKQLSKENPDLIFTAKISFEADEHDTLYTHEFKNGEDECIGLKAQYSVSYKPEKTDLERQIMGEHYDSLYNKAIELFSRIDIAKFDQNNGNYIDWVSDISLTVEDEDYQMEVTKVISRTEVTKCLKKEKVISIKLVPILESYELPF